MKGIIFNLLEEVVTTEYGPDVWEQLLASIGSDGAYTSLGSYPDEHIFGIVATASQLLGQPARDVLQWFGRKAIPLLAERYPGFFQGQTSTRQFLLSVNNIIHPEVRKVYPGAVVPTFEFQNADDGGLLMGYRSPRRLCALAQGFTEGAAQIFSETISFTHLKCMLRGDDHCLCHISFPN